MAGPEQRLTDLALRVPAVVPPAGVYVPAARAGAFVYTSGQVPLRGGRLLATGQLGGPVSVERGYECARQCALNALAALNAEIGDLSAVVQVVKVLVFVSAATGFTELSRVGDGASELLCAVFGDAGRHARSVVGVSALPLDAPVELEGIFAVS